MTPSLHGEGVMGSSLSRFPTLEDLLPSFPSVPLRSSPWISVTHSPRVISDPFLGSLDLLPLVTLQAPSLWTPPPYPFLWTPSCPRGTFQPPTFGNPMTPSPGTPTNPLPLNTLQALSLYTLQPSPWIPHPVAQWHPGLTCMPNKLAAGSAVEDSLETRSGISILSGCFLCQLRPAASAPLSQAK